MNGRKKEFQCNVISESISNKPGIMNWQETLSFILLGDSTMDKTCFLNRYFKNQFTEAFLATIEVDKEIMHE